MNRREFIQSVAGSAVAVGSADVAGSAVVAGSEPATGIARRPFEMRGVYFHDGFDFDPPSHAPLHWDLEAWRRQVRWLAACGVNAVEFATMLEANRVPSTDPERKKVADRLKILDEAHRAGLKFGYLLTNTVLSTVPPDEPPSHQLRNRAVTLCPRQPGNFEKTIANPRFYMKTYREADFFEEFAADWGGCQCGQCGVPQFLRYVSTLAEDLTGINSRARLYANTWCIAYWGKDLSSAGWKAVFDKEISGSREVIAALPALPRNVGIGLPCHHLYRPLALSEYGGRAKTPPFPVKNDIETVHQAGRKSLAWPHFVMDDDAFRPKAWGIVHSEVRYIQAVLRSLRQIGVDSVIGNLYLPLFQISNTYAFGRLSHDPDLPVESVIADFARLVVEKEDADALADILAWMDNHSSWQQQMPRDARLPDLPVGMDRKKAAQSASTLRPNPRPALPLPISPAAWLQDLRRSIDRMDWA